MLRAILSRKTFDTNSGLSTSDMFSIDFDNQEIEEALSSGGSGPSGYDITDFVGVEVLGDVKESDKPPVVARYESAFRKIAEAHGIGSPLELMAIVESNDENYADLLAKRVALDVQPNESA